MKTGKLVQTRKNHDVFTFMNEKYDYAGTFNLIKKLPYHHAGKDCNWNVIKVHDITTDKDAIALVFEESASDLDWWEDFNFIPVKTNGLTFHKGFFEEFESAKTFIDFHLYSEIKALAMEQKRKVKDIKVFVLGWSLGASIAPIAVWHIFSLLGIKSTGIIYEGANPCYNEKTRKEVQECFAADSISFVYGNDIVPRCPPVISKLIEDYIYYLDDKKNTSGIKKLVSLVRDTKYYHNNVDEGILKYMPKE